MLSVLFHKTSHAINPRTRAWSPPVPTSPGVGPRPRSANLKATTFLGQVHTLQTF